MHRLAGTARLAGTPRPLQGTTGPPSGSLSLPSESPYHHHSMIVPGYDGGKLLTTIPHQPLPIRHAVSSEPERNHTFAGSSTTRLFRSPLASSGHHSPLQAITRLFRHHSLLRTPSASSGTTSLPGITSLTSAPLALPGPLSLPSEHHIPPSLDDRPGARRGQTAHHDFSSPTAYLARCRFRIKSTSHLRCIVPTGRRQATWNNQAQARAFSRHPLASQASLAFSWHPPASQASLAFGHHWPPGITRLLGTTRLLRTTRPPGTTRHPSGSLSLPNIPHHTTIAQLSVPEHDGGKLLTAIFDHWPIRHAVATGLTAASPSLHLSELITG